MKNVVNRALGAKKKIFTILFALIASIGVVRAEYITIDGITYEFTRGGSSASVYSGNNCSGDISIPSTIEAYQKGVGENIEYVKLPVVTIGDGAFEYCGNLISITLPSSVINIGNDAFRKCSNLISIDIPNSVKNIGYQAFEECNSLTSMTIPNSVTNIGSSAFSGCTSLISITIPNSVTSIGDYVFSNCTALTTITIPSSVTSIGNHAFSGCTALTSITIPNSVTSIGNHAFSGCTALTSITIPSSVTSIGRQAFQECNNLLSLIIDNSVITIGEYAFYRCSSLISIDFTNSVLSIGKEAFACCSSLTSVKIPNGVTYIDFRTFGECSSLTSIDLPSSLSGISSGAFNGCYRLSKVHIHNITAWCNLELKSGPFEYAYDLFMESQKVTNLIIPNGTSSIKNYVFEYCRSLTAVEMPKTVTSIGRSAFSYCTSLASVTIPNSVTGIGNYAFYNCSSLTSITIPNSVTNIGENAFGGCTSMTSVAIGNNVGTIGDYAFGYCSNVRYITNESLVPQVINENVFESVNKSTCRLKVPTESYSLYKSAPVWRDFLIETDSISICVAGYGMCGDGLGWIVSCDSSVLTITGIGDMTTEWELNEAPWYPFKDSIKYIFLPKGITSIGNYAFRGCSNVKEITCNALTPPTCGTAVFSDIDKKIPLHLPEASIDLYKIADQWEDFFSQEGPAPCITAYGKCGDDLAWKINCDKTELEIIGSGNMYNYDWNTSPWYSYRTLIRKIHLPEEITSIGQYAFYGCSAVDTIVVPDSVTTIAVGAFMACSGLQYCQLGNHVTQIGSDAFYGCSSIVSMDIPASVMSIAEGAMPTGNLAVVNVADGNSYYCSIDGILFNKVLSLLHTYPSAKESATYAIPESVYKIGKGAFSNSKLRYVSMPNSISEIGSSAFAYCYYLDSINLPASIKTIGNYAFNYCLYLQSVRCEAIIPPTCGTNIFYNVNVGNIPLYVPAESLTAYSTTEPWRNFSPIIPVGQSGSTNNGITVRLNPQSCAEWSVVRLWAWTSSGNLFDAWPGIVINKDEDGWYSYTFDESLESVNIIWTDGINQTVNIEGVTESTCYSLNSTTGKTITVTIEQCPDSNPTDFETIDRDVKSPIHKILRSGQIYILRGDKTYTLTGQEVR